ncbi:hypothetical protein [Paenarthrobacter nicotinovorans]|uniref:hypothetical protein n=1 Tax=Paenarthrobacter nicotinovorans TaxID=29320 RepID=UPI0004AF51C5|nr:hypothetical protein [Paenarthrobacter nicotinovorans]
MPIHQGGWPMRPPDNASPPDNYAAFIQRLDDAAAHLGSRLRSVLQALGAVSVLLEKYQAASLKWEHRRARVSMELDRHTGGPEKCAALGELHDTAVKMVALHHAQTTRINERMHQLRGRRDAIQKSLAELETAAAKLKASRAVQQDRHNLNTVLYELAGAKGGGASIPDHGLLNDLKQAREAVILAEALMEVKGDQP